MDKEKLIEHEISRVAVGMNFSSPSPPHPHENFRGVPMGIPTYPHQSKYHTRKFVHPENDIRKIVHPYTEYSAKRKEIATAYFSRVVAHQTKNIYVITTCDNNGSRNKRSG